MGLLDFMFGPQVNTLQGYQLDPMGQEMARRQAAMMFGASLLGRGAIMDPGGALAQGMQQSAGIIQQGQQRGVELARRQQIDEERRAQQELENEQAATRLRLLKEQAERDKIVFGWQDEDRQNRLVSTDRVQVLIDNLNSREDLTDTQRFALNSAGEMAQTNPGAATQAAISILKEVDSLDAARDYLKTANLPNELRQFEGLIASGQVGIDKLIPSVINLAAQRAAEARFDRQEQRAALALLADWEAEYQPIPGSGRLAHVDPKTGEQVWENVEYRKVVPGYLKDKIKGLAGDLAPQISPEEKLYNKVLQSNGNNLERAIIYMKSRLAEDPQDKLGRNVLARMEEEFKSQTPSGGKNVKTATLPPSTFAQKVGKHKGVQELYRRGMHGINTSPLDVYGLMLQPGWSPPVASEEVYPPYLLGR